MTTQIISVFKHTYPFWGIPLHPTTELWCVRDASYTTRTGFSCDAISRLVALIALLSKKAGRFPNLQLVRTVYDASGTHHSTATCTLSLNAPSDRRVWASPVLQLLPVDAHGPLVALGHTHLVAAASHLLTRVLGGVQGCTHTHTRGGDKEPQR